MDRSRKMRTYNLFISHSWAYGDAYDRLVNLLEKDPFFHFRNYSVPKNDPIHSANSDAALYRAIKAQIAPSSVVLILAGVYSTYSKWINKEIEIAQSGFLTPKPILAIEPWGSEKTSTTVKDAADEIVQWNTSSIITAIKRLA